MQKFVDYYIERNNIYESHFKYLSEDEKKTVGQELANIDASILEDISGHPVYNNHYYIEFKNPFCNRNKFSRIPGDVIQLESLETIKCIGIADKLGRIYLHGVWESSEPAYIEYKPATAASNKYGKMYETNEGWHLTRKEVTGYKVKKIYNKHKQASYITENRQFRGVTGIDISSSIICIKQI